jgi:hypothetical protein
MSVLLLDQFGVLLEDSKNCVHPRASRVKRSSAEQTRRPPRTESAHLAGSPHGGVRCVTLSSEKESHMKLLLLCFALVAFTASAADISGNWKATGDAGNGPMERTFQFKQDGAKLTGETTSSMMGKSAITDGKVEGDNVTFTITVKFQDNEMKLNYKGKISGSEIKFTVDGVGGGQTIEWNAKKVS